MLNMYQIALFLGVMATGLQPAAEMTWEEVSAIANQNRAFPMRVRVQWNVSRRDEKTKAQYYLSVADSLDQQAKAPGVSDEARTSARLTAEFHRRYYGHFNPHTEEFRHDFWSDRANFQIRQQPDSSRKLIAHFPDEQSTADNLATTFASVSVLSYGTATRSLFRTWQGNAADGQGMGSVATRIPENTLLFPPFCYASRAWPGTPLTMDLFWDETATESTVLGEYTLDQRKCIVVRRIWPAGKPTATDRSGSTMLAWIDLERGGVPLRIERYHASSDQIEVNPPGLAPSRLNRVPFPTIVVRDVAIATIGPGFFYPESGTEQTLGPPELATIQKPASTFAPHATLQWKATKVELNREMSAENFQLTFPSRTVFFNAPTSEMRVTTDSANSAVRLVQNALGRQRPQRFYDRLLTWLLIPLAGLSLFGIYRWRRTARP